MSKFFSACFAAAFYLFFCCFQSFAENNYDDPPSSPDLLYIDVGVGAGIGSFTISGSSSNQYSFPPPVALNSSFKIGARVPDFVPLMVVGELKYHSYIYEIAKNASIINFIFVGPGVIFYPLDHFQIAASLGLDIGTGVSYLGAGGNFSVALDVKMQSQYSGKITGSGSDYHLFRRRNRHGILIGLNIALSVALERNPDQGMFSVSAFIKYRYLNKEWPIFFDRR